MTKAEVLMPISVSGGLSTEIRIFCLFNDGGYHRLLFANSLDDGHYINLKISRAPPLYFDIVVGIEVFTSLCLFDPFFKRIVRSSVDVLSGDRRIFSIIIPSVWQQEIIFRKAL